MGWLSKSSTSHLLFVLSPEWLAFSFWPQSFVNHSTIVNSSVAFKMSHFSNLKWPKFNVCWVTELAGVDLYVRRETLFHIYRRCTRDAYMYDRRHSCAHFNATDVWECAQVQVVIRLLGRFMQMKSSCCRQVAPPWSIRNCLSEMHRRLHLLTHCVSITHMSFLKNWINRIPFEEVRAVSFESQV